MDARTAVLLALAAIVAFYLATRFALLWRFPPFLDESLYASWAKEVHDNGGERFVSLANGKEPLLPWLGAVLIQLGAAPLTAVRLVSVGCGLVTMTVTAVLGGRLGGRTGAVAAAGLYAVLPYFVVHDVIGLYEPLLTALAMLALYLQIRFAERSRLDLALLLGVVLGAGLLTKQGGFFALALLPVSLLCFRWSVSKRGRRLLRWAGGAVLSVVIAGAVYSVLKLSDLYSQFGRTRSKIEPVRSLGAGLAHPGRWFDANWPGERALVLGYVTAPLLVVLALGILLALKRRPRLSLVLLAWSLLPLAAATLLAENTFARYLLQAVPPLVVFLGYGFLELGRIATAVSRRMRVPSPSAVAVGLVGLALLLVPASLLDGRALANPNTARYPGSSDDEYATGWAAGNAWRAVAHELERRVGNTRTVVTTYAQGSPALGLELAGRRSVTVLSADLGGADALNSQYAIENGQPIPASQRGNGTLKLVWDYRRPRDGTVLELFQRGIVVNGSFYGTPEELRAGLRLSDRAFDALVNSHAEIKAWYDGVFAVRNGS